MLIGQQRRPGGCEPREWAGVRWPARCGHGAVGGVFRADCCRALRAEVTAQLALQGGRPYLAGWSGTLWQWASPDDSHRGVKPANARGEPLAGCPQTRRCIAIDVAAITQAASSTAASATLIFDASRSATPHPRRQRPRHAIPPTAANILALAHGEPDNLRTLTTVTDESSPARRIGGRDNRRACAHAAWSTLESAHGRHQQAACRLAAAARATGLDRHSRPMTHAAGGEHAPTCSADGPPRRLRAQPAGSRAGLLPEARRPSGVQRRSCSGRRGRGRCRRWLSRRRR